MVSALELISIDCHHYIVVSESDGVERAPLGDANDAETDDLSVSFRQGGPSAPEVLPGLVPRVTGERFGYHIGAGLTCMSWSLYSSALVLGSLIRAALFTFLGSRVAELGIREAWPAFLILAVFFLPLLHPRVRIWVGNRLRGSSDAGKSLSGLQC